MEFVRRAPLRMFAGLTFRGATPWSYLRAAALILTLPNIARAEAALAFEAPCGERETFLRQVAALQPSSVGSPTVASVKIARQNDGAHVLEIEGSAGRRTVVDPDCETLLRVAVVIAATSYAAKPAKPSSETLPLGDELTNTERTAAFAKPETDAAAAPAPGNDVGEVGPMAVDRRPTKPPGGGVPRAAVATAEAPVPISVFAGGGGGVFAGVAPGAAVGIEALAGVRRQVWSVNLGLRWLPPRTWELSALSVRQSAWAAVVGASTWISSVARASVGVSGYWIDVRGFGDIESARDGVGLLAPELELAVTALQTPSWRGEVAVMGRVGLNSPRFVVAPDIVVFEVPRWGLGGALRFLWDPG